MSCRPKADPSPLPELGVGGPLAVSRPEKRRRWAPGARIGLAWRWLASALLALLAACDRGGGELLEIGGPTMGTYYSVKVAGDQGGIEAEELRQGIEGVLAAVVAEISTYEEDSELSRLNRDPSTDWIGVSENLLALLTEGRRLSALSGGAFDITVGPLVNLWGFGPEIKPDEPPPEDAIRQALARVGFGKLELRDAPPAIRKQRGDLYIDLSALGEGYGADRVAAYLDALGIGNYMVAVAGAIRVKGKNAKGTPWAIAIEEPRPGQRAVYRILQISNQGLSTSGDYRNFFEQGGRRYSHEIDPKTGAPVTHRLASVTVVSPSAAEADGLATALMVMGGEQGPALARDRRVAAFFILREDAGFREIVTPAFQGYLAQ